MCSFLHSGAFTIGRRNTSIIPVNSGVFTEDKWVPVDNGAMDSELVPWIKELFSYPYWRLSNFYWNCSEDGYRELFLQIAKVTLVHSGAVPGFSQGGPLLSVLVAVPCH